MADIFDLLLVGGLVVTGQGVRRADVGVVGEQITALANDLANQPARKVIDASNRLLLPGVIDAHVHPVYLDNMEQCSRVAAFGGTTTLLHFAYARPGESLVAATARFLACSFRMV